MRLALAEIADIDAFLFLQLQVPYRPPPRPSKS